MTENDENKPSCFVVMPISDIDGYDSNHFHRVYEHLIKPACIEAGYIPVRSDDVLKTNYIIIDIIRKVLDSEIVLCDLSGKNPNVLYELGVRQAFNLPTILIKDKITEKIFDIQGLRYVEYDHNLRIDSVQKNIAQIARSIKETSSSSEEDINSIMQLINIKPATKTNQVEISSESKLILNALEGISARIEGLESSSNIVTSAAANNQASMKMKYNINGHEMGFGDQIYLHEGEKVTELKFLEKIRDKICFKSENNEFVIIKKTDPQYKQLDLLPF